MKREDLKVGTPIYEHAGTIGSEGILVGNIKEVYDNYIVLDSGQNLAIKMDREELYVSDKTDCICLERSK